MDLSISVFVAPIISAILAAFGTYIALEKRLTSIEVKMEALSMAVEKHNNVVERTYKLENDVSTGFKRIDDLRHQVEKMEKSEVAIMSRLGGLTNDR